MTTTVRDNPEQSRYEIFVDDELAGFGEYKLRPGRLSLLHTEVLDGFSGRGIARKLVVEELADARERGLAVLPFCSYVQSVIAKDPDRFLDLVPVEDRPRFEGLAAAESASS